MAAGQGSKDPLSRRRRARREDDEEESVAGSEDSQSQGSAGSDVGGDDEIDADGSDVSRQELSDRHSEVAQTPAAQTGKAEAQSKVYTNGPETKDNQQDAPSEAALPKEQQQHSTFRPTADTDAMMNGLRISDNAAIEDEVEDFDNIAPGQDERQAVVRKEHLAEKRKREQDEYRKKRDADPTFIPNRGNFFMHDARIPEQRGFAPQGRGRGRGRVPIGGPFSPAGQMAQVERTADAPWKHDLHETINVPSSAPKGAAPESKETVTQTATGGYATTPVAPAPGRPYNFSSSKLLGKVQIRVFLPNMQAAIPFAAVPVKQHTRLPDHRPPLRRDKPVRISLPDKPPRYIFPSQERSFIFIPRALRPNQQGFGRARGSFGYGPSSRHTSVYGGSVYSPSLALSRRSSLARDVPRDQMFSPVGSITARSVVQGGRPVVRLPQGMVIPPTATSPAGSIGTRQSHAYPLPQTPAIEHYREAATMHQPRPQKTISVSGIDSPAALSLHAPQQQHQQPFENQLPHHITDPHMGSIPMESHGVPYYAYQGQAGTPLSNIPERAIHAQPFQPPHQAYGQPYYGQYPQQGYYFPSMPVYGPQHGPYMGMQAAPAPPEDHAVNQHHHHQQQPQQQGPIPHESNGMVYYIDPSQVQQYPQQGNASAQEAFHQNNSYAVPGMGGMMTPSPDNGYYFGGPAYYQQS